MNATTLLARSSPLRTGAPTRLLRSPTQVQPTRLSHTHVHGHALPTSRAHAPRRIGTPQVKASRAVVAALSASCAAFTFGALYPPDLALLLSPRAAPPPPDPDAPASLAYTAALEETMDNLPLLRRLRAQQDAAEWYETRPYLQYPVERRVNSFTAGALRGPGKLAVAPLVRVKRDESEAVVVVHVGRGLCGHDGIVHGGMLATILDEVLGRTAIMNLPEKIGVTASLTVDYRSPAKADQFLVFHTRVHEVKGRKAYVEGRIEDLDGTLIAHGRALFVQPKYAKMLSSSGIKKMVGEPQPYAPIVADADPSTAAATSASTVPVEGAGA